MRPAHRLGLLLLLIACVLCSRCSAESISRETLGIAPQDEGYYKTSVIKCKDGSAKFTREQLNDDFCDCPDGTDEPGTSACPEGKFYCRNMGHTPIFIFSSRVNDGICDCCDGSDEYDGRAKCSNTCWEAGKAAREKLKKRIATYQEGVTIRKQEVKKAQDASAKDESDLSKLKNEEKILKGLVQKLKEHKERIEKVEEQERLRKEEEQKAREMEKKDKNEETQFKQSDEDTVKDTDIEQKVSVDQEETEDGYDSAVEDENDPDGGHESSADHAGLQRTEGESGDVSVKIDTTKDTGHPDVPSNDKLDDASHNHKSGVSGRKEEADIGDVDKEGQESSTNTEGLSKEELGRLVASRWTGENIAEKTEKTEEDAKEEEHKDNEDSPESVEGDDDDGYNSEIDDDRHKYDDDDNDEEYEDSHSDTAYGERSGPNHDYDPESDDTEISSDFTTSSSSSWLSKIQQTVQNVLQAINLFKTPVNISEAATVKKEYDDASSKLSKIQSRITSLTEKLKQDFGVEKEFYSFYDHCFENKQNKYVYKVCPFKQASQVEGYSTTRLGNWEKFDESYRVMQFLHGDKCWNGPDRSLKVRLRCGLKNELTDVDEPSRCEYMAVLSTPVLCVETKLKELQQKLELMNSGQPLSHDEL